MGQFVGFFFDEFRKKQIIWEKYIAVLTEIDCLISLSVYSYQSGGVRPKFRNETFRIKAAKHPCLASNDLIPNNIVLDPKVMLLTGPNMGGKSTYLRTTCLLAILAQVGVFVLAQEY